MSNIFISLPLILAIIVFILKRKLVKNEDGKKNALIEMIIDILKFIIMYSILILLYVSLGIEVFKFSTMLIDLAIIGLILFVFLGGNHRYQDRKAIGAMFSFLLMLAILLISFFKMLIGTFSESSSTYAILFLKVVASFFAFTWAAFTAKSVSFKYKVKDFYQTIIQSFRDRDMNKNHYFFYGILSFFLFVGDPNDSFMRLGLFGIHEVLNRKYIKGSIYIVVGNIILLTDSTLYGQILFMVYTLFAIIDLIWQFFKIKK